MILSNMRGPATLSGPGIRLQSALLLSTTQLLTRPFSSSRTNNQTPPAPTPPTAPLNPRWLSDLKTRLGKCIHFGMDPSQTHRAGTLLSEVSTSWKTLLAGSEGFLTTPKRAGINSVPVNWGDQDSMGHVNNVQYVRFCETSRTNWTRQIGEYFDRAHKKQWDEMLTNRSYGLILKSIKVEYKFPMTWPDRISAYHKIRVMPTAEDSSMLLDVMIVSEGRQRVVARAEEDVVVYDYKGGRKSVLPGYMLEQFRRQFEEQEGVKGRCGGRVREMLGEVERLEGETWGREGAREELGGAS